MKIEMIKSHGGVLCPASDLDEEKLTKFRTGEQYQIEIKLPRNHKFHGKVFSFFQFAFHYWKSDREFMDEAGQFDVFRKQLTVLAGFYDEFYKFDGSVRIEAKSLSYGNMSQEEFEQVYTALVNAAMRTIFQGCDEEIENKLMGFF